MDDGTLQHYLTGTPAPSNGYSGLPAVWEQKRPVAMGFEISIQSKTLGKVEMRTASHRVSVYVMCITNSRAAPI